MKLTKVRSLGGYVIMQKWTDHNLHILHLHRNTWTEGLIFIVILASEYF